MRVRMYSREARYATLPIAPQGIDVRVCVRKCVLDAPTYAKI